MTAPFAASTVSATQTRTCTVLGREVSVDFVPVADEWSRRQQMGLSGVADRSVLRVLFGLPSDVAVAREMLSAGQIRVLRRAPVGVCSLQRCSVTRLLVPAVRVQHVTLESSPSRAALRDLSQFAPFAPQTLFTTRETVNDSLLAEAAFLGIGVRTQGGRVLGDASWRRPVRHTPAGWLFVEAVTEQVLDDEALF